MKVLKISSLLLVLLLTGCAPIDESGQVTEQIEEVKEVDKTNLRYEYLRTGTIQVFEIEGCEYITWDYYETGNVIHKKNCSYCLMRNQSKK